MVELDLYLPEGAKKAFPATAVPLCTGKSFSPSNIEAVQVLVSLNIPIESLKYPTEVTFMAVNVDRIDCQYEPEDVRNLLCRDSNSQALVDAVTSFIPTITPTIDYGIAPLLTPPDTSHRRKRKQSEALLEDRPPKKFPCHNAKETKELINSFVQEYVVASLNPSKLKEFALSLGLTDTEYENIKYNNHYQNPAEQIFNVVSKWFEKKGTGATAKNFSTALQQMKHKELQDNFLYCCEKYEKD